MGLEEKWGWLIVMMIMVFGLESNGCWGCLKQERDALLHLKALFKCGKQRLASWSEDEKSDCCNGWKGVTCGSNRRVSSLSFPSYYGDDKWDGYCTDLPYEDMEVQFNASILLPFQDLRQLFLSSCGIVAWTEAKSSIKLSSTLTKLELLDLSNNYLNNNIIHQLSGFHSLRSLSLGKNIIAGHVQVKAIDAISKNLKQLDLSGNDMLGFAGFTNGASGLKNLEVLDLSSNFIRNASILPYLSLLPSLKRLRLGDNQVIGIVQLDDFKVMHNLNELNLSGSLIHSWITYNGTVKLSTIFPKLELLDLSGNIDLGNNILLNLSGLPSLKYLTLTGTGLTGQITLDGIEDSKNLRKLDLGDNNIEGLLSNYGTMKLSRIFPKLELLDLSGNRDLGNNILLNLSGLLSLKYLRLTGTGLTGQITLDGIVDSKNLLELDLSENNITGFLSNDGLAQLWKLKKLDLSGNELSTFPPCWANLTSLQVLDLSQNHFSGNIALSPLVHIPSLEILLLSGNNFQIPHSFKSFRNHTKLKYFVADSNHIIQDDSELHVQPSVGFRLQLEVLVLAKCGITMYPPFLHRQQKLLYVDLSHNSLKGDFPSWLLQNNMRLETLILQNNSISIPAQLPAFTHTYVSDIYLSHNNIQGQIPINIASVFPKLRLLDMSNSQLKGLIPSDICDMPLSELYLSNNQLLGGAEHLGKHCFILEILNLSNNILQGELPSLNRLPSLGYLDLHGNNFSGSIKGLCTLHNLHLLDLSHNKLNGSMPDCFGPYHGVSFIYLNNNRLTGSMSSAFNTISLTTTLDLSYNEISGEIPAWTGNLSSLRALLLKGNQFYGQIPLELCKLVGLRILDLSYNNLSGPIPPCLGHIAESGDLLVATSMFQFRTKIETYVEDTIGFSAINDAEFVFDNRVDITAKSRTYTYSNLIDFMFGIDLSSNRLAGEIPPELGNLSNLQVLNLSHNNLWGAIPASFSNMKEIESLDLSYNSLNGHIPSELAELNSLGAFWVAHNNLSGEIPFKGQLGTFIESSYEGNPFLCGLPLNKSCKPNEMPSGDTSDVKDKDNVEEDEGMDTETFYVSFAASGMTMFLAVQIVLWINPHWRRVWFYPVEICLFQLLLY